MSKLDNKSKQWRWWKNKDGSPSDKLVKLELAFAQGNSDENACAFAEITLDQLYYYTRQINAAFQVKKEQLKAKPILAATAAIIKALSEYTDERGVFHPADIKTAKWYLERKAKNEFSTRTELTGSEGKNLYELPLADKIKLDRLLTGEPLNAVIIANELKKGY